jgi:hypothetical protein
LKKKLSKHYHRKLAYTQYGGLRPFGVAFLFAGWDKHYGFQLYQVRRTHYKHLIWPDTENHESQIWDSWFLCLTGWIYVFYVGHIDKLDYENLFHVVILSKHHQYHHNHHQYHYYHHLYHLYHHHCHHYHHHHHYPNHHQYYYYHHHHTQSDPSPSSLLWSSSL